jgi:hypothetical protein
MASLLSTARRLSRPVAQECQSRGYWQQFVLRKTDKDGKLRYEDPERVVKRFQEARQGDGAALLDVHLWNDRHEKPWMEKRRLAARKRYNFDKKHVMDLAKYIQFVQDNKEK